MDEPFEGFLDQMFSFNERAFTKGLCLKLMF